MLNFDIARPRAVRCACKDLNMIYARNEDDCDNKCKVLNHCEFPNPHPCVEMFQPNVVKSGDACHCVDGEDVFPSEAAEIAGSECNEICSDTTLAGDGLYHGINWNLKIGPGVNFVSSAGKGKNFTVEVDKVAYYDFSEVRDCKDNLVHFAINFNGKPGWTALGPDEWCCMDMAPACVGTWGNCCNGGGTGCPWCVWPICRNPSDCYNDSDMYPSLDYPIYAHIFDTVSFTPAVFPASAVNNPEEVWVGISVKIAGVCEEFERFFQIDVIP